MPKAKKECRFCGKGDGDGEPLVREAHNRHTYQQKYGKGGIAGTAQQGPAPGETWVSHYHPTCLSQASDNS